jgi:hypothetical protein
MLLEPRVQRVLVLDVVVIVKPQERRTSTAQNNLPVPRSDLDWIVLTFKWYSRCNSGSVDPMARLHEFGWDLLGLSNLETRRFYLSAERGTSGCIGSGCSLPSIFWAGQYCVP